MDRLSNILSAIPEFYDYENNKSIIYNIIKSLSDQLDELQLSITQINNLIGINNTNGADLQDRWGNLLNIDREYGESDEVYRNRLKLSCTAISGGTRQSIKYAVAISLNIQDRTDDYINSMIQIYDGWK